MQTGINTATSTEKDHTNNIIHPRSKVGHICVTSNGSDTLLKRFPDKVTVDVTSTVINESLTKNTPLSQTYWSNEMREWLPDWLVGRYAIYLSLDSPDKAQLSIANAIASVARSHGVWLFCFLDCTAFNDKDYEALFTKREMTELQYHAAVYPYRMSQDAIEDIPSTDEARLNPATGLSQDDLQSLTTFSEYVSHHKNYVTRLCQRHDALSYKPHDQHSQQDETNINLNDFLQLHLQGELFFYSHASAVVLVDHLVDAIGIKGMTLMSQLPADSQVNSSIGSLTSKQALSLHDHTLIFGEMSYYLINHQKQLPTYQLFEVLKNDSLLFDCNFTHFIAVTHQEKQLHSP